MRLTVSLEDRQIGTLNPGKHYYLNCHIKFSHEERAIIDERGLYHVVVTLPMDVPYPARSSEILVRAMRIGSRILLVVGLLAIPILAIGAPRFQAIGFLAFFAGMALWAFSWVQGREQGELFQIEARTLTIGQLVVNPNFTVHAYSPYDAKEKEEQIRLIISQLSDSIKASAEVAYENTYDL